MQLKIIASEKIKTCALFEYPATKIQLTSSYYEPPKVVQTQEHYLLVDGYQRWKHYPQNKQKCLVFPNSYFLKLWSAKLLNKFQNGKTNWIFLGELLQKMAKHKQISVVKLVAISELQQIIPHSDFLKIILEMFHRKDFLLSILPLESWTMQTYKVFQKLNNEELKLIGDKFKKFKLNFNQYKQILETLYDLKRLKKQSISSLLEFAITDSKTSLASFQNTLFNLKNPVASEILQKRAAALQKLKLATGIKINYDTNLESPYLNFYWKTKNIKDLKKFLFCFQNKLTYSHEQIDYLYNLL